MEIGTASSKRRLTWLTTAGLPVPGGLTGEGRIEIGELPGGALATTAHLGPYDKLSEAHAALRSWLAKEGRSPTGAPWESYVTDPTEQPDPEKWETRLFHPLGS